MIFLKPLHALCFFVLAALVLVDDQIEITWNAGRHRVVPHMPANAVNVTMWHPWALREHVMAISEPRDGQPKLVLGMHVNGHDASVAATWGGKVIGVVELERLHKIRYFDVLLAIRKHNASSYNSRLMAVLKDSVAPAMTQLCQMVATFLPPPSRFVQAALDTCEIQYDVAVVVTGFGEFGEVWLRTIVKASSWVHVDHHHAHAAIGWLDSPFYHSPTNESDEATLILSYDGMGNDGTLRVFIGRPGNATLLPLGNSKLFHSYGTVYYVASFVVRDLAWGSPYGSSPPCPYDVNPSCFLALAGSFMAFAAIGDVHHEWHAGARLFVFRGLWDTKLWPSPYDGTCQLRRIKHKGDFQWMPHRQPHYFECTGADEKASRQLDRDFAATVQSMFEEAVLADLRSRMRALATLKVNSLVISGGCALNVKVNSFLARGLGLPTHVPPAPGDQGLSLGGAWLIDPPATGYRSSNLQFVGAPLVWGAIKDQIQDVASQLGAIMIRNVAELAGLLIDGAIVGVARGRAEFGPRALGHRSFLAAAHMAEQKDRLNRLKHRRWYRPCAPIVAAEDLEQVFEPGFDLTFGSPYMSFAPPLQQWVPQWLPGIAHIDNTARPQSVHQDDDPWMHSLLAAVRFIMSQQRSPGDPPAVGVLINTSLNPKGKPIASDIEDVLKIFCMPGGEELDYVLIEETWLFNRSSIIASDFCGAGDLASLTESSELKSLPGGLPVI